LNAFSRRARRRRKTATFFKKSNGNHFRPSPPSFDSSAIATFFKLYLSSRRSLVPVADGANFFEKIGSPPWTKGGFGYNKDGEESRRGSARLSSRSDRFRSKRRRAFDFLLRSPRKTTNGTRRWRRTLSLK
jgi:hypothetical protein